jgi:hypothetical protein
LCNNGRRREGPAALSYEAMGGASCRGWVEEKVFRMFAEWMVLGFDAYIQRMAAERCAQRKASIFFSKLKLPVKGRRKCFGQDSLLTTHEMNSPMFPANISFPE